MHSKETIDLLMARNLIYQNWLADTPSEKHIKNEVLDSIQRAMERELEDSNQEEVYYFTWKCNRCGVKHDSRSMHCPCTAEFGGQDYDEE